MAGFGLNLKLVLCLQSQCLTESLGFLNPPLLQAAKRCIQYIFRTYAESFSPIFSKKFIEIVTEKSCAKIENRTNFVDKLCVEITFSGKFAVKIKAETKNCVKICFA